MFNSFASLALKLHYSESFSPLVSPFFLRNFALKSGLSLIETRVSNTIVNPLSCRILAYI